MSDTWHHRKGTNVRKTVLATAVAAALSLAAAERPRSQGRRHQGGASQAVQAQMQALTERLNKLEADERHAAERER